MGPVALVFLGIPAALSFIDEGLKGILMLRDQRRAERRVEDVGEQKETPSHVDGFDDDMLYPVCIDAVLTGRVLKKLNKSEVYKDILRGAERAQRDKQVGEVPCCKACGRIAM